MPSTLYAESKSREFSTIWAALRDALKPLEYPLGGNPLAGALSLEEINLDVETILAYVPTALEEYQRGRAAYPSDPSAVLTAAKAMVEAASKWVLKKSGLKVSKNDTAAGLYRTALAHLIGPDEQLQPGILQMARNIGGVVEGLSIARNKMGSGHGKEPESPQPTVRSAALAFGLAIHVCAFLLSTFEAKKPD